MSFRRIGDLPEKKYGSMQKKGHCYDPNHNPPAFMVLEDGVYENVCPSCGHITNFSVRNPKYSSQ